MCITTQKELLDDLIISKRLCIKFIGHDLNREIHGFSGHLIPGLSPHALQLKGSHFGMQ